MKHPLVKRLTKRSALKGYALKLSRLLVTHYGYSKYFTIGQVQTAVTKGKLNTYWIRFAYAMFLKPSDFKKIKSKLGYQRTYSDLRGEVRRLFFIKEQISFTIDDLLKLSPPFDPLGARINRWKSTPTCYPGL